MSNPRKVYPSDVSDDEWALVAPYLISIRTQRSKILVKIPARWRDGNIVVPRRAWYGAVGYRARSPERRFWDIAK
jgi:hypothetical protein